MNYIIKHTMTRDGIITRRIAHMTDGSTKVMRARSGVTQMVSAVPGLRWSVTGRMRTAYMGEEIMAFVVHQPRNLGSPEEWSWSLRVGHGIAGKCNNERQAKAAARRALLAWMRRAGLTR